MLEKAVRSLISKKQDGERIEVLSLQIDETDKRISEDACLALAIARGLEQADPVSKNRIRNALAKSIESPGAGVKVSGLLSAMLRVDRVVAAKTSWQLLLDKKHKALHGLAEQTLSRSLSVTTMLKSAPPLRTLDDETCRRVLNLLGNRKSKLASPLVRSLLENSKGQARKFAAMTLLRLGSSRKDLERSYGQELAKDAALLMEQRRARRKSRFRAIFKRGAR